MQLRMTLAVLALSLSFSLSLSLRYVKGEFAEKQELTFEEVNMLNKLNIELCHFLNTQTGVSVFQPFQHGNFTCVLLREVRRLKRDGEHFRNPFYLQLPKEMDMFNLLENVLMGAKNFEKEKEVRYTLILTL